MSLRSVEEATSVSNAYLSQLERGKIREPSLEILRKLALYYGVEQGVYWRLLDYPLAVTLGPVDRDTFLGEKLTETE